jgi:hypothetical protein
MRVFLKLVFVGMVVLLLVWLGQRRLASLPVAVTALPPTPVIESPAFASPPPSPVAPPVAAVPPPILPAPFATTLARIHQQLHRWLAAQKNAAEDDEAQSMLELQSLLTDENAAAIVQSLSADERDTPFGLEGIRHWMHADPVQASNWIAARPDATQNQTGAVAQGWTADPVGLQNYAALLPDTPWKQSFLSEAIAQFSARDPAVAVQLAQQMTPGNDQTSRLQSVACNWVASDPNAALDWISGVTDPSLREKLVASAAQSYALTDPALAAAWLASMVKSDALLQNAALNIAQTWVAKDPAAAASWASQFPEGNTKTAAQNLIVNYWQQTDPAAASAWLQNLSAPYSPYFPQSP